MKMKLPTPRPRRRLDPTTRQIVILDEPPLFIRTWQQAEENAARWMRALGYRDAVVGKNHGPDGGIDVHSARAIAQVKCRAENVGRPELQQLFGAGAGRKRELWFFASSDYTDLALEYADINGMFLFTYSATGELTPINRHAERKLVDLLINRANRIEKWREHRLAQQEKLGWRETLNRKAPLSSIIINEQTLEELFARAFPDPRTIHLQKEAS
jgi:hypothetical protein